MAWGFSTDPEFQAKLGWMDRFVRAEIWPLETLVAELEFDGLMRVIAMIKFFGAKVLHDVVDRALQVHGALGYSTDMPLEAMHCYARAARIYDGPDEVHRASVARQILRGYEAPADGVPTEHVPTRRERARAMLG